MHRESYARIGFLPVRDASLPATGAQSSQAYRFQSFRYRALRAAADPEGRFDSGHHDKVVIGCSGNCASARNVTVPTSVVSSGLVDLPLDGAYAGESLNAQAVFRAKPCL